ncbi:hypothetical protein [Glycomyces xiaoerkulensis]|uniref:hypothetical protein n=1 Tax=Glycomyces xiaoerkulensis TaxID=2038139 RepID=UPI000C25AB59|nr:hypothetical protein [Glycomyces xiaoerkulensis]
MLSEIVAERCVDGGVVCAGGRRVVEIVGVDVELVEAQAVEGATVVVRQGPVERPGLQISRGTVRICCCGWPRAVLTLVDRSLTMVLMTIYRKDDAA